MTNHLLFHQIALVGLVHEMDRHTDASLASKVNTVLSTWGKNLA